MKNKLRKILVDDAEYNYTVTNKYHHENSTNTLTVKVFLKGQKNTPLVIEFLTIDDYYMGQLLNVGLRLIDARFNTAELVNLNQPKFAREFILLGLKAGWTGKNKIEPQDGLLYLYELGYEVSMLLPAKLNIPNSTADQSGN